MAKYIKLSSGSLVKTVDIIYISNIAGNSFKIGIKGMGDYLWIYDKYKISLKEIRENIINSCATEVIDIISLNE